MKILISKLVYSITYTVQCNTEYYCTKLRISYPRLYTLKHVLKEFSGHAIIILFTVLVMAVITHNFVLTSNVSLCAINSNDKTM